MGHQSHDDFSQKKLKRSTSVPHVFRWEQRTPPWQHLAWNGLILSKDDPFWNNHFPPNGYGCKCFTRTGSEPKKRRYEREGIKIPPKADGSGASLIRVQTKAPAEEYKTYFKERKEFIERIPKGIAPGFAWNQGKTARSVSASLACLKKAQDKLPEAVGAVIQTPQSSKIYHAQLADFVDETYRNKALKCINKTNTTAVGFFDKKITDFLRTQGIDTSERNVIVLEQSLITSEKFLTRHTAAGNAPLPHDWKNLLDYLADADVDWDNRREKISLLFLKKISDLQYIKIAVDVMAKERFLKPPKIDSMYYLNMEGDSGIDEYKRILELKRIR